jgi:MFS family permease
VGVLVGAALLANYGPDPLLLGSVGVSILVALAYGPAALAALAELSESITRATTMAIYTLVISLGMIVGLVASTSLFGWIGNVGLDLFFGVVGVLLVALTLLRYHDVRTGRAIRGT